MCQQTYKRLQYLCDHIPALLGSVDEKDFALKPEAAKWSKKEILGHLIDSATNNHHRFVRAQFEQNPCIAYDQNLWNESNFYQQMDTEQLISFWTSYNRHLLHLFKCMPEAALQRKCLVKNGELLSVEFLMKDYLTHLEHHLQQIAAY